MNPDPTAPRPTLQDVATAAGVSQMTVSRALGGRGRVAEETRRRITTLAERLGYRPDPQIAKLMHHLRNRRTRRFQSVIVGLTTRTAHDRESYFRALVAAAAARVTGRGYGFELMHLPSSPDKWIGLNRTLRSRGVDGLLLLPQRAPIDLTHLLTWEEFSVVSTSASALGPPAHRVMPHHFANTILLCRTLAQRGHRRIGLVIAADHDRRSENGFTAAVTWHGLNETDHFVPPLVTTRQDVEQLRAWYIRERPDAIITNEPQSARECARVLGLKLSGPPRFVVTSLIESANPGGMAGIDERADEIGKAAADLLTSMVERRVQGRPDSPASTLLTGRWVE